MKPIEFTKNAHGCNINKLCCSCAFCTFDNKDLWRRCTLYASDVKPDNICSKWLMRPALDRAGDKAEEGQIKKLDYLMYVQAVRDREHQLQDQKLMKREDCQTLEQIRVEWEQDNNQSIYMDL